MSNEHAPQQLPAGCPISAKPLIPLGMTCSGVAGLLSQIPALSNESGYLQYGALGILGFTIVGLFFVIDRQQKANTAATIATQQVASELAKNHREALKDTTDRWDGWERTRHDDSEKLHTTLMQLSSTCAARRNAERTA